MGTTHRLKQVIHRQHTVQYEVTAPDHDGFAGNLCPVVMLVHGFTEDRRIWQQIIPGLEKKYRFILPDLPGSGSSPANPHLETVEDFAGALNAICEAENAERVIVIGHSMGGYISLAFAELFPARLRVSGFSFNLKTGQPGKKAAREKNQDFIRRNGVAVFVRQSLPGLYAESFRTARPETMEEQIARYANFAPEMLVLYLEAMKIRPDRSGILTGAKFPVLFIMGGEDKVVPPAEVLPLCRLPRISYIHVLPRTAHMGMVENPTLCISCLDRFLDQFTW